MATNSLKALNFAVAPLVSTGTNQTLSVVNFVVSSWSPIDLLSGNPNASVEVCDASGAVRTGKIQDGALMLLEDGSWRWASSVAYTATKWRYT